MNRRRPADRPPPSDDRDPPLVQLAAFIGMHIIVTPPQLIIIGMPLCIMLHIASQHFMNMSFMAPSRGIISQVIPVGVMVHFI